MEINQTIDKLLRSRPDDQRIALEILKCKGYTDLDKLCYVYRFQLLSGLIVEYFSYEYQDDSNFKCLGRDGKETTTHLKLKSWK